MHKPPSSIVERSKAAAAGLLLVLLAACGGGDDEPTPVDVVPVSLVGLGNAAPGTYVFRTREQWTAFWADHPALTPSPAPEIDFSRHAAAGIFRGPKPRCSALEVTAGESRAGVVRFRYRIVNFGQGTPSSCIGGDPSHPNLAAVVLVPKPFDEVRFEEQGP